MNAIYVLALVSLALVAGVAVADPLGEQVEKLCYLKKDAARINQQSEVRSIIGMLRSGTVQCKAAVGQAILDLEPVIDLKNVCSKEATDVMVDYWQTYVSKDSKKRKYLPKQLKNFFLGFGLQASKLCKRTMIAELEKASQQYGVTEQDINIVAGAIREKVNKIFEADTRVENLLAIVSADSKKLKDEKIGVDLAPKQKKLFDLQQERCAKMFKPIYDTLIAPVVRLAAIGISYNGDQISDQMSAFQQQPLYKEWFAVVLACEASSRYRAVVIPKEKTDAEGNTHLVTLLDEDDLAELREETGLSLEGQEIPKQPDYKSEPVAVDNLVIDDSDSYLKDLIKHHRRSLSAVHQFQLRMVKRLPTLMKVYLNDKAVRFGLRKKKGSKYGTGVSRGEKIFWYSFFIVGSLLATGLFIGTVVGAVASHGSAVALITILGSIITGLVIGTLFLGLMGSPSLH